MYKLYVGDYVKEGTPATWTLVHSSCCEPIEEFDRLGARLKYGMDLYLTKENKLIARYYGGKMCASKEPKSQFEDIQNLKEKIKMLSKKIIQLKPELKGWIKKNFVDSWHDSEEE